MFPPWGSTTVSAAEKVSHSFLCGCLSDRLLISSVAHGSVCLSDTKKIEAYSTMVLKQLGYSTVLDEDSRFSTE